MGRIDGVYGWETSRGPAAVHLSGGGQQPSLCLHRFAWGLLSHNYAQACEQYGLLAFATIPNSLVDTLSSGSPPYSLSNPSLAGSSHTLALLQAPMTRICALQKQEAFIRAGQTQGRRLIGALQPCTLCCSCSVLSPLPRASIQRSQRVYTSAIDLEAGTHCPAASGWLRWLHGSVFPRLFREL